MITVDLERQLQIPPHFITSLRPDIVVVSEGTKHLMSPDLTVSWEERMKEAHKRKEGMVKDRPRNIWRSRYMPVVVGCRGFTSLSWSKVSGTLGIIGVSH